MNRRLLAGTRETGTSRGENFQRHLQKLSPACVLGLVLATCGCQVLTYSGANGERLTRSSLGAKTSISSLSVESDTNGIRRVEMRGYQNDSTQALGIVTEAAVRAALQGAKPIP